MRFITKSLASIVSLAILFTACHNKQSADLIVYNGVGHTMISEEDIIEALVVKDGIIIDLGNTEEILDKYQVPAKNMINVNGKSFFPGLTDAHCHLINYARSKLSINLVATESFDKVIDRIVNFEKRNETKWLIGRGWDQNDWDIQEFPTKNKLDSLFPDQPIYLTRIDGHAAIANQKALDLASIDINTTIEGGQLLQKNGELTGVLIDNAMELVKNVIPKFNQNILMQSIEESIHECNRYGLTSFHEAGLEKWEAEILLKMEKQNKLHAKIYVMLVPSKENLEWIKSGLPQSNLVKINAIKLYADGALGSRGALLSEPYHDHPQYFGLKLMTTSKIDSIIDFCYLNNMQLNTHCIGDSANHLILSKYAHRLGRDNDRRWRIEHAQVVNPAHYHYFKDYQIIPSVQPTHATSDKPWAENRLGPERIHWAYSYKNLYELNEVLAVGTDFPIEEINPFFTIYSAVYRKNARQKKTDQSWQMANALSRYQCLKGMTKDAAFSSFMEQTDGVLSIGKSATFTILERDPMTVAPDEIPGTFAVETYIDGKRVYNVYNLDN